MNKVFHELIVDLKTSHTIARGLVKAAEMNRVLDLVVIGTKDKSHGHVASSLVELIVPESASLVHGIRVMEDSHEQGVEKGVEDVVDIVGVVGQVRTRAVEVLEKLCVVIRVQAHVVGAVAVFLLASLSWCCCLRSKNEMTVTSPSFLYLAPSHGIGRHHKTTEPILRLVPGKRSNYPPMG